MKKAEKGLYGCVTNFVTKIFFVTKKCTLFIFLQLKVRKGQTFVTKKCNVVTILKWICHTKKWPFSWVF